MIYKALQLIGFLLFVLLFRLKVKGVENIPKDGGAIICANHSSYLDPIILGIAIPRKVHHMAKDELFKNPFFARIITFFNAFPVKRGFFPSKAFKTVVDLLKDGELVIIYPEGTRSRNGKIQRAKLGIGVIVSLVGDIPIIPTRIIGTHRALPTGAFMIRLKRCEVRFGKPLRFNPSKASSTKEYYKVIAETIMDRIKGL
jgi:1-acyl-sn-glycerol-3-phosphate acyltransferase